MDIKKVVIASASTQKEGGYTTLQRCWTIFSGKYDIVPFLVKENKESLSMVYNWAITRALEEDADALILVHDDVILEHDPIPKLEKLFDQFDLVGVAGTSKIELKSPALWHLMGGGFGSGNLHGAVAHGTKDKKHMTSFGVYPHQCILIDGVFMAMNKKVMEKMRFDEYNPAKYHFYDCLFSCDCHKAGFKVGVGDIMITHESPGLREFTEDWKAGEKYFISKYAY